MLARLTILPLRLESGDCEALTKSLNQRQMTLIEHRELFTLESDHANSTYRTAYTAVRWRWFYLN